MLLESTLPLMFAITDLGPGTISPINPGGCRRGTTSLEASQTPRKRDNRQLSRIHQRINIGDRDAGYGTQDSRLMPGFSQNRFPQPHSDISRLICTLHKTPQCRRNVLPTRSHPIMLPQRLQCSIHSHNNRVHRRRRHNNRYWKDPHRHCCNFCDLQPTKALFTSANHSLSSDVNTGSCFQHSICPRASSSCRPTRRSRSSTIRTSFDPPRRPSLTGMARPTWSTLWQAATHTHQYILPLD